MHRHFHGFESAENTTLIPTMINRGHGRLAHTKEYVAAMRICHVLLLGYFYSPKPDLSSRMEYGSTHRIKQEVSCLQWFGS